MRSGHGALPEAVERWRSRLTPVRALGYQTYVLDEGTGEPVVLLHGIPTHSYLWRDVASVLSLERRVIVPDLLGFGFADRPGGAEVGPVAQARFITGVLDELGVGQIGLVVHDLGALVGCEILRTDPERVSHLTITNTSLQRQDWTGDTPLNATRLLTLPGVGELAFACARPFMLKLAFMAYVAEHERLTDETMQLYWHPFENGLAGTLLSIFRDSDLDEETFAGWREALGRFEGESLVAWGMRDPTFGGDRGARLAELLQNSRLVEFRNSNHFIQEDRPRALGRLILAALGDRLPRDTQAVREDPKAVLIR